MTMVKLAFLNFKNGFKHYLSLIISQAFTILVLYNFQNIIHSRAFEVLGTRNREYIQLLMQMVSFVLVCFMFFFIWYSTNVFLTKRKKEIGIYAFMGLSNETIGQMYLLETIMIGLSSLVLGIGFGTLSAGLFQMILMEISGLSVEIQFLPKIRPVLVTIGIYLAIYMIFAIKGYVNLVKSSVLTMILAAKQNESFRQNKWLLLLKGIMGAGILGLGYSLALKDSRGEAMANAFGAVVLVTAGVYLLFGGMLPIGFQAAAEKKEFLYSRKRVLWVNNMIFRIRRNYRTYAIVCILMLCSVTALALGFAMRERYQSIIHFENTYTFQLISQRPDLDETARSIIAQDNEIISSSRIPVLNLDQSRIEDEEYGQEYGILPYSQLQKLAEEMGMEFPFQELAEDEVIKISHMYLLSMITQRSQKEIHINGQPFCQVTDVTIPYLGYLQERMSFYVVNDFVYERLRPVGEELYTYNYKIGNPAHFFQTRERLDEMIHAQEGDRIARVAIDPNSNELDWIKVLYSICVFMFLVFIIASGSIMFMKLYNDAFEEKERYQIMMKQSIAAELATAYGVIFFVMAVSSVFSVKALAKMMFSDLTLVNLVSVAVVFAILLLWYVLSFKAYGRNVGLRGK